MQLHYRELSADSGKPVLLLLHGLFGSSHNLLSIGKALADDYHVILPDLRNHGRSPHDNDLSYQAMAGDVLELLDQSDCGCCNVLGHSLGGKVAMWLALEHADRINHLLVADIAPVRYPNRFADIIAAMSALPLDELASRQAADEQMASRLDSPMLRGYLLQNLVHNKDQGWSWRINLDGLSQGIDTLMDFPGSSNEYDKPVMFLRGEQSNYLVGDPQAAVWRYFPLAELVTINNAGHWLYADQPAAFVEAVKAFLP